MSLFKVIGKIDYFWDVEIFVRFIWVTFEGHFYVLFLKSNLGPKIIYWTQAKINYLYLCSVFNSNTQRNCN